jgi:hypothetical protein
MVGIMGAGKGAGIGVAALAIPSITALLAGPGASDQHQKQMTLQV